MKRFIIKKAFTIAFSNSRSQFPIKVVFANGRSFQPIPGEPEIIVTFRTNWSEWKTVLLNYVGFCECYRDGSVTLEGEDALRKFLKMNYAVSSTFKGVNPVIWLLKQIQEWRLNNKYFKTELSNLYWHYGLNHEFFHHMNGELYGYTEGYYETGQETQNEAQFKKYDYMCRKLLLKPGHEVVEVGTAWGTMALLMAKRYGARVTNYGLVPEQNKVFERRINELGLQSQVVNVVKDARHLGREKEKYDRYVSLGVLEHAGKDCLREWIENIEQALKPGGVGVLTFVGYLTPQLTDYVIAKYIWRGCYFPSLEEMSGIMADLNLHIVDVENSRFMYADTMRVMMSKMNEHWDKISALDPKTFDDKFRRIWNLYYTGSSEAFYAAEGKLYAFQLVFTKGRKDVYPRTREFLYKEPFNLSDMHDYEVAFPGTK